MNKFLVSNGHFNGEKYSWNDTFMEQIKLFSRDNENLTSPENVTYEEEYNDYIFDSLGVRIPFIIIYSIVFCGCVLGKLILFHIIYRCSFR